MRGTRICLRPHALRHNLQLARQLAGDCEIVAMIKANGYGHGLTLTAAAFAQADRLGVAVLDEAIRLRQAGINTPILLAEGCFDAEEFETAANLPAIASVIHAPWQVDLLVANPRPLEVWLNLDSGMHRLGMNADEVRRQYQRLSALPGVTVTTLMTHLACADMPQDPLSGRQITACTQLANSLGLKTSIDNSAALLRYPLDHIDSVRPGILLYGATPLADEVAKPPALAVTQTFSSRLIAINTVPKGETVGYGGRWRASQDSRIGVVAAGYGDGYPRHADDATPVAVNTTEGIRLTNLAGRVSMDMITIDLTDLPTARVGDQVELWGDHVDVNAVAYHSGTISYELFCQVTERPERIIEKELQDGES